MTIIFSRRCFDGSFMAPSALYASVQSSLGHSETFSPMIQRHRFALIGQVAIVSLVAVLSLGDRPAAIARLVIAVVVNAIDRVLSGWARPKIREEGAKRVAPFITHRNPSCAVVAEVPISGRVAPGEHVGPYAKLCRLAHSVRDVCGTVFFERFALAAPARGCVTVSQVIGYDAGQLAAIASTPSAQVSWRITFKSHHDKTRKALTWKRFGHTAIVQQEVAVERLA